jgi:hypothetical protein
MASRKTQVHTPNLGLSACFSILILSHEPQIGCSPRADEE